MCGAPSLGTDHSARIWERNMSDCLSSSLNGEFIVWLVSSHLPLAHSSRICIVRVSSLWPTGPGALGNILMYPQIEHPGDSLPPCPPPFPILLSHHQKYDSFAYTMTHENMFSFPFFLYKHPHSVLALFPRFKIILPESLSWTLRP